MLDFAYTQILCQFILLYDRVFCWYIFVMNIFVIMCYIPVRNALFSFRIVFSGFVLLDCWIATDLCCRRGAKWRLKWRKSWCLSSPSELRRSRRRWVLIILIQCCGSGIRCLFDPWIRDPRWVKNLDPDSGPDCIFESLETIFRVKLLKKIRDPGWADRHPG
jgi:hypothetical protein